MTINPSPVRPATFRNSAWEAQSARRTTQRPGARERVRVAVTARNPPALPTSVQRQTQAPLRFETRVTRPRQRRRTARRSIIRLRAPGSATVARLRVRNLRELRACDQRRVLRVRPAHGLQLWHQGAAEQRTLAVRLGAALHQPIAVLCELLHRLHGYVHHVHCAAASSGERARKGAVAGRAAPPGQRDPPARRRCSPTMNPANLPKIPGLVYTASGVRLPRSFASASCSACPRSLQCSPAARCACRTPGRAARDCALSTATPLSERRSRSLLRQRPRLQPPQPVHRRPSRRPRQCSLAGWSTTRRRVDCRCGSAVKRPLGRAKSTWKPSSPLVDSPRRRAGAALQRLV